MNIYEEQLMDFLRTGRNQVPLSVNERSLQVFGNEKFLNSNEGKSLLHKYHIPIQTLNVYQTPEPFVYYKNPNSESHNALIIENKDTWYTMRNILKENGKICGMDVLALIYGEGRKIQNSFSYINESDTEDIRSANSFYYFGDIDTAGIDIFYKLKSGYPAYYIEAFKPAYQYLYRSRNRMRKKDSQIGTRLRPNEITVLDFLGPEARVELLDLCNNDFIIPQEILNNEVLKSWEK